MNTLPLSKKALILSSLVEGLSIRSIERLTNTHRDTIMRLLVEAGTRASDILDSQLVNLESKFIEIDEIWTYVGKKQRHVLPREKDNTELGDQYVFIALDAETKLVPLFIVGKRTGKTAYSFISDLRGRIKTRFQLSSDSFGAYYEAVHRVFGSDIDYGQIHKSYREPSTSEKRYSPPCIASVTLKSLIGEPIREHISTSYIERQNLTMRMQMRRFTRLTNGFSKKFDNLKANLALYFFYYNFVRVHQSLRVTPAMQANVTNHIWNFEELLTNRQLKQAA
ncbi:MAG: IS1 family transposase [Ignavibacteriales bacterium]|nr:IS1 family transposase [Ignavibacteriales bacterium]